MCPSCGTENAASDRFCAGCGFGLIPSNQEGSQAAAEVIQSPPGGLGQQLHRFPSWESFRQGYLMNMRNRVEADGEQFVCGDVEFPGGGSQSSLTVAFFKAPKKWASIQSYFLIKMTDWVSVSRDTIESFYRYATQENDLLPQKWRIPPQYGFLEEGRLYPKGFLGTTGVVKVALLATGEVDDEAKEWVVEKSFKSTSRGNNYAAAAIIDLGTNELFLGKHPRVLGISYLTDTLARYVTP